ncbi:UNVERIFIED_CONTAM: hypothetical protein Sangu_2869300 [Sesamum angustifolium]|uniref:DUF4283 domain-containing protein n=1 Tax=Sesamum angustifolium TaxID=2727405 RepID=A0AAW2IPN7_9LAMI
MRFFNRLKKLFPIPPSREKGNYCSAFAATVEKGAQRWHSTAVGYFLGKKPYFPHVESYVRSNWKDLQQVSATSNGFYFFRFKNRVAMEDIIEGGPWLIQGQPIVLQCWEQGMSLRRQTHPNPSLGSIKASPDGILDGRKDSALLRVESGSHYI